jgi:hypothetical protein
MRIVTETSTMRPAREATGHNGDGQVSGSRSDEESGARP